MFRTLLDGKSCNWLSYDLMTQVKMVRVLTACHPMTFWSPGKLLSKNIYNFIFRLYPRYRYVEVTPAVCLEAGINYEIRLYLGRKRINYPDERARILIDSIVLAPPTEDLEMFQGSEAAAYNKMVYDRFQCRHMALSLTPSQYLPPSCNQTTCAVAGAIFGRGLECECDPTGSISGVCTATGGQCECKPNVVGRK